VSDEQTSTSEYYDTPVDVKAAQETYKKNQPPAGNYVTLLEESEPEIKPFKFEGDDRQFYTVVLRAGLKVKGGDIVEQSLRFRFSPEVRPATKFGTDEIIEGKDDSASKRYAEIVKAYLDWAGEDGEPLKTMGQLIQFIQTVPLTFRTMNGDNGLTVVGVSLKRNR